MKAHPQHQTRAGAGFTLLELLIVMMIISILAGLVFAVGPGVISKVRKQSVETDIQELKIAIMEYFAEYGRFPVSPEMQGSDAFLGGDEGGASTLEIMNVLLAEPEGWNADHKMNPKRIAFFNPRPAKGSEGNWKNGLGEDGKLYDMWGKEYRILLDTDYNDAIDVMDDGFLYEDRQIQDDEGKIRGTGGVMIQSLGVDGVPGKAGAPEKKFKGSDDICSWL